jgi:hypothetical protein
MPEIEATKGKAGWTDRQRLSHSRLFRQRSLTYTQLAYFFSLADYSDVKLDYIVSLNPTLCHSTYTNNKPRMPLVRKTNPSAPAR